MNREQSLLSILYSLLTKIKTLIPKWDERQPAVPPKFLHWPFKARHLRLAGTHEYGLAAILLF
ncbi:MAG: hypothetical protein A3K41_14930 [Chloroflexi bacterium RIFOXYD12_FULL_57_15]|nr:MAG: hypothetical protein A3K41_14930 [Chloroflexi bacterium RIFOXYD12_FULL_57_15]